MPGGTVGLAFAAASSGVVEVLPPDLQAWKEKERMKAERVRRIRFIGRVSS
jgi:hypothetical protein